MYRTPLTICLGVFCLVALSSFGCGSAGARNTAALTAKIGKPCEVQFRRNLLGTAGNVTIPPGTGAFNGAEVMVSGKLSKVTEDWIVLTLPGRESWIPRENILLLWFPTE